MINSKRLTIPALAALATMAASLPAAAEYPEDTVTIVVNSSPGGGADALTRIVADALSKRFGVPFVVENKPGAGGNIAGGAVAGHAPDGYTLLMGDSGMLAINPSLYSAMPFDPIADLTPISAVAKFPIVISAHPGSGISDIKTLVERAKADPGKMNYASTGIGSPQHLTAELLQSSTGIKLNHIPYKGGANALVDMIAGRVDIGLVGIPPTAPRIESGELVGVAVSTAERSPLLPNTPTIAESVAGFETSVWFGLMAPKGTPQAVTARLRESVIDIMEDAEIRRRLNGLGYTPMATSVEDFSAFLTAQIAQWQSAVEQSGAKVE